MNYISTTKSKKDRQICKYFQKDGICKKIDCEYKHDDQDENMIKPVKKGIKNKKRIEKEANSESQKDHLKIPKVEQKKYVISMEPGNQDSQKSLEICAENLIKPSIKQKS